jgi:hypothetical protein
VLAVALWNLGGCHTPTDGQRPDGQTPGDASGVANCAISGGVTTLFQLGVTPVVQPTIVGAEVLLATATDVLAVPLSGGGSRAVTSAMSPSAPIAFDGTVYYNALETVPGSDPSAPQPSEQQFFEVPFGGGTPTTVSALKNFVPIANDESFLYLRDANGVVRWAPPAPPEAEMPIDTKLLVTAITVQGGSVYLAALDVSVAGPSNGVIVRMAPAGSLDRLVVDIGHPANLVSNGDALYWTEDDPKAITASSRIERLGLDANAEPTTLLSSVVVRSLAAENGRLYLSTGSSIESMLTTGGAVTTLASGQTYPGLIAVSGYNIVWVDPFEQSLSGTAPVALLGTCLTP